LEDEDREILEGVSEMNLIGRGSDKGEGGGRGLLMRILPGLVEALGR
jgi:hypothetical protein